MKYMVLCMLDLEHVFSPLGVLEGLAGLGLTPVEHYAVAPGSQLAPCDCVVGQFRASDPAALEHQLRVDIEARLRRLQVEASFRVFVQALEVEFEPALRLVR